MILIRCMENGIRIIDQLLYFITKYTMQSNETIYWTISWSSHSHQTVSTWIFMTFLVLVLELLFLVGL